MHANSPLGRADRQSPINALARRFSLPILGGYSHATTCAFNRNPRLKSRVNVAPAIVEAGGLGDGWAGATGETGVAPRLLPVRLVARTRRPQSPFPSQGFCNSSGSLAISRDAPRLRFDSNQISHCTAVFQIVGCLPRR